MNSATLYPLAGALVGFLYSGKLSGAAFGAAAGYAVVGLQQGGHLGGLGTHKDRRKDFRRPVSNRAALIAYWSSPQYLLDQQRICAEQGRLWYSSGARCI